MAEAGLYERSVSARARGRMANMLNFDATDRLIEGSGGGGTTTWPGSKWITTYDIEQLTALRNPPPVHAHATG